MDSVGDNDPFTAKLSFEVRAPLCDGLLRPPPPPQGLAQVPLLCTLPPGAPGGRRRAPGHRDGQLGSPEGPDRQGRAQGSSVGSPVPPPAERGPVRSPHPGCSKAARSSCPWW